MKHNSSDSSNLDSIWQEKHEIIKRFFQELPKYENLCIEVAYIIEKFLKDEGIEYSTVSYRAKTLNSFIDKIILKKYYDAPFSKITDMAGVRIVHLYRSDFSRIEEIIESEFDIIEKIDKIEQQGSEQFGYGAVHFLVRLGQQISGARYDDLKDLLCEIQVRTILQDAWAIIGHHLVYKQKSVVPNILKRKLNSLAGLFETADDQFDKIRSERKEYVQQIESKFDNKTAFLKQKINLDTARAYLKWRFPTRQIESYDNHISFLLAHLDPLQFTTLIDFENTLLRTEDARKEFSKEQQLSSAADDLALAIAFVDKSYVRKVWSFSTYDMLKRYYHLVK